MGWVATGHERGWSADATGLVEACWIAGSLAVSLLVARVGTHSRPILPMVAGAAVAGAAVLAIAVSPVQVVAMVAAGVMGVGTVLFTAHVFPLFLLRTPDGMLARFQSLLGVAQFAPMLLANNLFGAAGAAAALAVAAGLTLLAPTTLLASRTLCGLR